MHRRYDFFKHVSIVLIIILLLTSLFWWFALSHTQKELADALFWAGAISIVIGFLLQTGSEVGIYNSSYQYFKTFGETTKEERLQIDREDLARSYSDIWILFTAGIIIIALSILIYTIF